MKGRKQKEGYHGKDDEERRGVVTKKNEIDHVGVMGKKKVAKMICDRRETILPMWQGNKACEGKIDKSRVFSMQKIPFFLHAGDTSVLACALLHSLPHPRGISLHRDFQPRRLAVSC